MAIFNQDIEDAVDNSICDPNGAFVKNILPSMGVYDGGFSYRRGTLTFKTDDGFISDIEINDDILFLKQEYIPGLNIIDASNNRLIFTNGNYSSSDIQIKCDGAWFYTDKTYIEINIQSRKIQLDCDNYDMNNIKIPTFIDSDIKTKYIEFYMSYSYTLYNKIKSNFHLYKQPSFWPGEICANKLYNYATPVNTSLLQDWFHLPSSLLGHENYMIDCGVYIIKPSNHPDLSILRPDSKYCVFQTRDEYFVFIVKRDQYKKFIYN